MSKLFTPEEKQRRIEYIITDFLDKWGPGETSYAMLAKAIVHELDEIEQID